MFVLKFARRVRSRLWPPAPSLVMRFHGSAEIAPEEESAAPELSPQAFVTRALAESEAADWVRLMNDNGELGPWTEARLRAEMSRLVDGLLLVVALDGRLVATASVHDDSVPDGPAWSIGWVARHPDYRGRGLGEVVVRSAVRAALQLASRPIILRTEDHRLDAICLYSRLGFRPDPAGHSSYEARWRSLGFIAGARTA